MLCQLYVDNEIIMSEEGAQQGDPLGSMLFCLAIQPIVVKLLSEFNVWYIDDGTIGGILSDILHDIHILVVFCRTYCTTFRLLKLQEK